MKNLDDKLCAVAYIITIILIFGSFVFLFWMVWRKTIHLEQEIKYDKIIQLKKIEIQKLKLLKKERKQHD